MAAIQAFDALQLLDTFISLLTAFVLGTIVGAERQYRERAAGLRTTVLVCVGAAAFVDLAMLLTGPDGAVRVISYVVSGVGFLGAGVIMKDGTNIRGLNTAATLWGSAAIGACAGADRLADAALVALFILAGNTLLRPLVNAINRAPLAGAFAEATYEVRATVAADFVEPLRETLARTLARADYPVREIKVERETEEDAELVATLVSTSAVASELDTVTRIMRHEQGVTHASWAARVLS
ncbi:MgtC/SapB family protein [Enterovirga rhinocerotis]|uniref:Protein MgtC n=1 Tax=Enterovirga rhinocerotis TaxID=1339210 RepID=A0A4R7BRA2_9HYPH|nr:MgtC/SapB family protein [Enterovirga rhinocerotis]TDR87312.1 putative Mg2+ transporter-C (MgtC) family protein [Enterovirga rhinocerotis]